MYLFINLQEFIKSVCAFTLKKNYNHDNCAVTASWIEISFIFLYMSCVNLLYFMRLSVLSVIYYYYWRKHYISLFYYWIEDFMIIINIFNKKSFFTLAW